MVVTDFNREPPPEHGHGHGQTCEEPPWDPKCFKMSHLVSAVNGLEIAYWNLERTVVVNRARDDFLVGASLQLVSMRQMACRLSAMDI